MISDIDRLCLQNKVFGRRDLLRNSCYRVEMESEIKIIIALQISAVGKTIIRPKYVTQWWFYVLSWQ